jgi:hypothetical protein
MHPDFEKDGYLVVREFFDVTTIDLLSTYFKLKYNLIKTRADLLANHITLIKNGDNADSLAFYADTLVESVLSIYGSKTCNLLKCNLSPTYTYARIYEKGSFLRPHTDRNECEISATCPIYVSDYKPSKIFLSNFKKREIIHKKNFTLGEIKALGEYTEVNLYPGDALFYKGVEHYHWREPLEGDYLIQFFMHYVNANGKYKNLIYDGRPHLGFPK